MVDNLHRVAPTGSPRLSAVPLQTLHLPVTHVCDGMHAVQATARAFSRGFVNAVSECDPPRCTITVEALTENTEEVLVKAASEAYGMACAGTQPPLPLPSSPTTPTCAVDLLSYPVHLLSTSPSFCVRTNRGFRIWSKVEKHLYMHMHRRPPSRDSTGAVLPMWGPSCMTHPFHATCATRRDTCRLRRLLRTRGDPEGHLDRHDRHPRGGHRQGAPPSPPSPASIPLDLAPLLPQTLPHWRPGNASPSPARQTRLFPCGVQWEFVQLHLYLLVHLWPPKSQGGLFVLDFVCRGGLHSVRRVLPRTDARGSRALMPASARAGDRRRRRL